MTPTENFLVFLSMLADIREALWYLTMATAVTPTIMLAGVLVALRSGRKKCVHLTRNREDFF